jgi:hypothetical protein
MPERLIASRPGGPWEQDLPWDSSSITLNNKLDPAAESFGRGFACAVIVVRCFYPGVGTSVTAGCQNAKRKSLAGRPPSGSSDAASNRKFVRGMRMLSGSVEHSVATKTGRRPMREVIVT